MKIKTLVMAMFLTSSVCAWAKTPSDASLNQLYQAMQVEKQIEEAQHQISRSLIALLQEQTSQEALNQLNPQQRQLLEQLWQEIAETAINEMLNDSFFQHIQQNWLPIAKQLFTQKEVDATIAFLNTSEGSNFSRKNTSMYLQLNEKIRPFANERALQMLQKHGPDWNRKIQEIFKNTDKGN